MTIMVGNGRHKEGFDPEEKYLPSVLINPTKHAHNIHFTPTNCKKMLELLFCAVNVILEKEGWMRRLYKTCSKFTKVNAHEMFKVY